MRTLSKGPSIAENVKQQKHTILPVFLSLSVVRGGRILPLESRSELSLDSDEKSYPQTWIFLKATHSSIS